MHAIDDPWYFSRRALAKQQLDIMRIVGTQAKTLFADRRTGKTCFLLQDMVPEAASQGLLPIYMDLWEQRSNALSTTNNALALTLAGLRDEQSRISRFLKTEVSQLGIFGSTVKFSPEPKVEMPSNPHFQIRWHLERIVSESRRPLLLMMDEFQQVASDADAHDYVASLRSALQQMRGRVFVIFSGSSESGLTELFRQTDAPLYNFSSHTPFPLLGPEFVDFLAGKYSEVSGMEVSRRALWGAFHAVQCQPQALKDVLVHMLQSGSSDVAPALEAYLAVTRPEEEREYAEKIDQLSPLDRCVLRVLVAGGKPTSADSLADYAARTGAERVYPNSAANCLRKMIRLGVVSQWKDGSYRITPRGLWSWLKEDDARCLAPTPAPNAVVEMASPRPRRARRA